MWWGILFGCIAIGLMNKIPRSYFQAAIGRSNTFGGLVRAIIAGLFLDLCNHGILMVAAKLYERGISLPQVIAFLIASPWNSFSLTLILFSLIGVKWTLVFIGLSAVIALITGLIFMLCVQKGVLPDNPNTVENPPDFKFWDEARKDLKGFKFNFQYVKDVLTSSVSESRMILRWLLFGTIMAGLLQVFVPTEVFAGYFGPSVVGLLLTLIAATIVEVCSEGMAPVGADLLNRAAAPGNSFTFLMAGVATDYTEILVIREFTKKWKIALFLPLISVPQILVLGYILNTF
jgi:hypothetical protein